MITTLALAFALLTATAHADHEFEKLTKSAQARALHRQLVVKDLQAERGFEVDAYRFDIQVMPGEARIAGTLTAELVAKTDLSDVEFDAKDLEISTVWFTGPSGARSEARFNAGAERVSVSLPVKVSAGSSFAITFAYSAIGDRRDGHNTPVTKGLYFVNADSARADVAPTVFTSVEPQLASTWFPCIDNPAMKAKRLSMRVSVPQGWIAVSNGALKSSQDGTFEWEHSFPIPTYLISLSISPYTVVEERWRGIPVQYFIPKDLEAKARHDFELTSQMLEHFSSLWMPYPYEKYAMATVPYYGGAMEHTTASTFADTLVTGDKEYEFVVAHELAHQWWGDIVTMAHWDDLWLNEGFATYAETLYREKFKGAEAAAAGLLTLRASYLRADPNGTEAVVDPKTSPEAKFNSATYEKGGWVVHMLRRALGDEVFFRGINDYLRSHAFGSVTTAQLRAALEKASGKDLKSFFEQWVYGAGYPDVQIKWAHDRATNTLKIELTQKRPFVYSLDLKSSFVDEQGAKKQVVSTLDVSQAQHTFKLPLDPSWGAVAGVVVDPGLKLLIRANVERHEGESRHLVESRHWQDRLAAVQDAPTLELLRAVAARAYHEPVAAVKAAMLALVQKARNVAGVNAQDFLAAQVLLTSSLAQDDVKVRLAAAHAAREYLSPEFTDYLSERFASESSRRVKAALAGALAHGRDSKAFDLFFDELKKDSSSADYLLEAFGALGDPRAAAILVGFVGNGLNPYLQRIALENLGLLGVPETFEVITRVLRDQTLALSLRISSAKALANYGGLPAASVLSEQLKVETDPLLKKAISEALEQLGGMPRKSQLLLQGSPVYLQW